MKSIVIYERPKVNALTVAKAAWYLLSQKVLWSTALLLLHASHTLYKAHKRRKK